MTASEREKQKKRQTKTEKLGAALRLCPGAAGGAHRQADLALPELGAAPGSLAPPCPAPSVVAPALSNSATWRGGEGALVPAGPEARGVGAEWRRRSSVVTGGDGVASASLGRTHSKALRSSPGRGSSGLPPARKPAILWGEITPLLVEFSAKSAQFSVRQVYAVLGMVSIDRGVLGLPPVPRRGSPGVTDSRTRPAKAPPARGLRAPAGRCPNRCRCSEKLHQRQPPREGNHPR